MIVGIGTDLIELSRVHAKIDKNKGFREAVFSAAEIAYCEPKPKKEQHYAARFAAKEALIKACGSVWMNSLRMPEISVEHRPDGQPYFVFLGETKQWVDAKNWANIHLSVAHLENMALAFVIIEQ